MPDHLGYRKIFGVTGPSTNTIVQPDFDDLRPIGVTNHYSRIIIPNMPVNNNEDFLRLVKAIMGETLAAIEVLKSCEMQYLVMGMSATTFWDGRKGAEAYVKQLSEHAGVGVSCGSFATAAALETLGAKRIAFFSPYFEVANEQVRRFYEDSGFTVVRDVCLKRPSPVLIAHSTDEMCRQAIRELDGDDIDAIVQVGTNLSMIRLAAAAELFLEKFDRVIIVSPREQIAKDEPVVRQQSIYQRIYKKGVEVILLSEPSEKSRFEDGVLVLKHVFTGKEEEIHDVVLFTYSSSRRPNDELAEPLRNAGVELHLTGDCYAPRGLMTATEEGNRIGNLV